MILIGAILLSALTTPAAANTNPPCTNPIELVEGDVEIQNTGNPEKTHREHRYVKIRFCGAKKSVLREINLERTYRTVAGQTIFSETLAYVYPDNAGVLTTHLRNIIKPPDAEAILRENFTEYARYDAYGKETCRLKLPLMGPDAISKNRSVAIAVQRSIDEEGWKSRHKTPYVPELGKKRLVALDASCHIIYSQDLPSDTPNQSPTRISDNGRWATYLHGKEGGVIYLDKIDLVKSIRTTLDVSSGNVGAIDDSGRFSSQAMTSSMSMKNGKVVATSGIVTTFYKEEGGKLIPEAKQP